MEITPSGRAGRGSVVTVCRLGRRDIARMRRQLCEARAEDFRTPHRGVYRRRPRAERRT